MRLLSWNIHKGIGGRDRRYSLARIMDCIESQNPDLFALQEVDRHVGRSRHDDQPRLLARHLGFQSAYQSVVSVGRGGYGNLILSRWDVGSRHRVSLRLGGRKPRGAQLLVVETPEGPLHLVNTHLGLTEHERQWQASRLVSHALFTAAEHLPTLLVGDFNDWRNTLSTAVLSAAGFVQVTTPSSLFRSFPAWLAVGSLDKAFVRGSLEIHEARILRTRITRDASDHLPLLVDFHIRPSNRAGRFSSPSR
ncbi:MAG: endonuclease/exonuclease/phosphatase family protein [Planctomycetaceae bacterium]